MCYPWYTWGIPGVNGQKIVFRRCTDDAIFTAGKTIVVIIKKAVFVLNRPRHWTSQISSLLRVCLLVTDDVTEWKPDQKVGGVTEELVFLLCGGRV
jgi:hypothetical protein